MSTLGRRAAARCLATTAAVLSLGCVALDDRSVSLDAGAGEREIPLAIDGLANVTSVELGIHGAFYAYDDAHVTMGGCVGPVHPASDCAPTPVISGFAQGKLCATGHVEQVRAGANGQPDYATMWGAGVGFDFANPNNVQATPEYDAASHGVIGIAFDLVLQQPPKIRVEVTTTGTVGNPLIWRPGDSASNYVSPLQTGHNRVLFSEIVAPDYQIPPLTFDPTQTQSFHLHMVTFPNGATPYDFCMVNVALITQ